MKVTILVATTAFTIVTNAQLVLINNPTAGTVWHSGAQALVNWTGSCATLGSASHSVAIDLVKGPTGARLFVSSLGTLDCSGSITSVTLTVPSNVGSGEYYVRVGTTPMSYSNAFQIYNTQASSTMTTTTAPLPTTTHTTPTGPDTIKSDTNVSSGLVGGIIVGVVAVVVIAAFFIQRNRRNKKKGGEKGGHNDEAHIKGQQVMEAKSSEPRPSHLHTQPQTFNQNAVQGHQYCTQPQGVTQVGTRELQQQYAFQFSNHPRPNMVTTANGNNYSSPQQPPIVWEPTPFVPSSSRVQPPSSSHSSAPQALARPFDPQVPLDPPYPLALPALSGPHT
ncbi:MAG: hypothetical protein JOS17DRAFT_766446 [Linnemannia elongata]|nr:MAG: hypothetical protein JOS17DRAFT_766446 [Linnemannia elongata]